MFDWTASSIRGRTHGVALERLPGRRPMTGDTIRVLLADDHAVVRAGLRAVLASAKDIEVVSEATSGREAVALATRIQPDVVVMDISMGEPNGLAATPE